MALDSRKVDAGAAYIVFHACVADLSDEKWPTRRTASPDSLLT